MVKIITDGDYVVKIPPKCRYTIKVTVKSIKKGEPNIIIDDEYLER